MSTNKKYDLILLGNLSSETSTGLDEFFQVAENVDVSLYLEIKISIIDISKEIKNKLIPKYYFCLHHINTPSIAPTFQSCRWTHIHNLDTCPIFNPEKFKVTSDFVSASLSLLNPSQDNINIIKLQSKYLDYLFISNLELNSYFNNSFAELKEFGVPNVIIFGQQEAWVYQDGNEDWVKILNPCKELKLVKLELCIAGFLEHQLKDSNDIQQAIISGYNK